ncbi:hypothetical protein [Sagittula sp. MA-2]|jgi:hypothetical protein|uniref:hypothetical protein n=1 Tax=Sagittula sp. MA-2 TaxID=3048007 RepID=UPI0024C29106|nr:hypothetical protein [Sagittula sp. MA-2]WHZ35738.1 hypothetical protein QNI11_01740 [Sagittula sp. MA-2]
MTEVLDRIRTLTGQEIDGWWWQITEIQARPELPGERAALIARAREIRHEIKGVGNA